MPPTDNVHVVRPASETLGWKTSLLWLAAAVGLLYWNALGGVFQFDDYNVIVLNPAVTDGASQASIGIRPLLKLTYRWDWWMGGGGELPFHLSNLLIHWGNACLVWWLAVRMAESSPLRSVVPLLAATLFVAHPLQTESVTYICGRSTSLMTLFYLAAMAFHEWSRSRPAGRGARWGSAVFFVLALAVKETAVTLPVALWLWDRGRGRDTAQFWRAAWPSGLVLLLATGYFLFNDAYSAHMLRSVQFNSLAGNLATQHVALPYLMRQWVLPLWPNIDPDLAATDELQAMQSAALLLIGLLVLTVAVWRRSHWVGFALAWALLQLVPLYLLLPRLDVANDRQWYLAGWPLCVVLALWIAACVSRPANAWQRNGTLAMGVVLLSSWGALTLLRNADYRSELALWEQTVALSPNKARVHNNLGYALQLLGRTDQARAQYEAALRLDSQHIQARFNLRALRQSRSVDVE